MDVFQPFAKRYVALTIAVCAAILLAALAVVFPGWLAMLIIPLLIAVGLSLLGAWDLYQSKHAVLRNYPILAHLRFLLEEIRPEMRQYFFEDEKSGTPFARDKRTLVYQRAKQQLDKRPFGTQYNVYDGHFEWLNHSMAPRPVASEGFRLRIGGPDCRAAYNASIFTYRR